MNVRPVAFAPVLLPTVPVAPVQQYAVGIPTDVFEATARPQDLGRQEQSNWCWAACIQMVLGFHGVPVQQAALAAGTFGMPVDRPARPVEILANLNGVAQDAAGRLRAVHADPLNLDVPTVLNDLANRRPLIVGLTGHAYVMTGALFHLDGLGRPVLDRVVLRDPWPTNPSRKELTAGEFQQRLQFATRVLVDR